MIPEQNMTLRSVADESPAAPSRRAVVEELMREAGAAGMTWKEFDLAAGWNHHGRSTAALSAMHKDGSLARLDERRNKCSVYVLPEYVHERTVIPHGPRSTQKATSAELVALRARTDALYLALDNLSHARGFSKHRHVWADEAKSCFLCLAREAVAAEALLREQESPPAAAAKGRVTTGAALSDDRAGIAS